jgi:hypothetical protein
MWNYFDIQESIEFARQEITAAGQSGDVDGILGVCELLLSLIERLNERDAPQ